MSRNPLLSERMEAVLRMMLDNEEELVVEGREAWVGDVRTSNFIVKRLLWLCAVKDVSSNQHTSFRQYEINEDGRGLLKSHTYVPRIVKALTVSLGKSAHIVRH